MQFHNTEQRKEYINARGKIVLNACPGSGKTTCIVQKLMSLEKECYQKYGPHLGIACLSFTNVAKDEILVKYKLIHGRGLEYPHLVSTIDSFVSHYITLPFFHLLDPIYKRPRIVDDEEIINRLFIVKYKDINGNWQEGISSNLRKYITRTGTPLFRAYPPSTLWIDINGTFTFNGKLPDSKNVDLALFQEYCNSVFVTKKSKGLITSLDASYCALDIIKKFPRVGQWLVKRFPYLIIDEAQDNSELQHEIINQLISNNLNHIELVGDPYQSLYEWRDAKPQLFLEKFTAADWKGLPLSENRRSVQRIIDCFSIVRCPSDVPIVSTIDIDLKIPIHIYKYSDTNTENIVKDFEMRCSGYGFQEAHIVVRGNKLKDRMLGNPKSFNPWKSNYPFRFIQTKHHFESNLTKLAVDELRKILLELQNPDLDYSVLKELQNEKKKDSHMNGLAYTLLYKMPPTSQTFSTWGTSVVELLKKEVLVDIGQLFEFKKLLKDYKIAEVKNHSINMYFKKPASTTTNIPISTIHQVKGASLDAILCFFSEDSKGQNVSFKDFDQTASFPSEKQRMIYVACSRPKQLLALAFPEKIADSKLKERFGQEISLIVVP